MDLTGYQLPPDPPVTLPGYCPGCGGLIRRIARHVRQAWTVTTCPHCATPLWLHQVHDEPDVARKARALRRARSTWE